MSKLYAGTRRIDITPKLGHNLAGWHLRREAERCITPILARALVLDNGTLRIVIISCDLLAVQEPLSILIREEAAKAAGTNADNVFIFPSHNHYGPDVDVKIFSDNGIQTSLEKEYINNLPGMIAACVKEACQKMQEVLYGYAFGKEEDVLINSRFRRKDGLINWVGDISMASELGLVDPQLSVISFVDENRKPVATIYHYGCHANCGEKDGLKSISWDWCGYASEAIEKSLGGEAFFILGPCGDIHPKEYGVSKEMGEKVAEAAVEITKNINYKDLGNLSTAVNTVELKRRDFTKYDRTQIRDFCSQVEDIETRQEIEKFCYELLNEELKKPAGHVKVRVGAILIGDIAISCIPGELFVELGIEIKQRSSLKPVLVAEIVNDYIGYIPTNKAYTDGGYQVSTVAKLEVGSGEEIVEKALETIERLKM
ncbi:MAG TPA: hypothetical protein GXX14_09500 [Clostridiaceae bacterium]|nr:hypothetical protein [Clostridiaceae bacterium]